MLRKLTCAVVILGFSVTLAVAADTVKGKVKVTDAEKNTITVTVADQDKTFNVQKDAKITTTGKKKKGVPAPEVALSGLSAVKIGAEVTLTVDKVDNKDVVTSIKVEGGKKKKKKNIN